MDYLALPLVALQLMRTPDAPVLLWSMVHKKESRHKHDQATGSNRRSSALLPS
jgi:hypothetical protein